MKPTVRFGIETLCEQHTDWLRGRRVGLVAHPASVTADGTASSEFLRSRGVNLTCLFGPEHGFSGRGGAGEPVNNARHPGWNIPIHSLYGETKKPTAAMLADLDVVVFDLQTLCARCYTYISTLRYVLEAAAEHGKAVIIADRPVPMAGAADGPALDPAFESFVGRVRTPVVYGMTSGEAALWLQRDLGLTLDLRVAKLDGPADAEPPRWVPSSPAIVSRESAVCFPITVFFEALPLVDHGRGTPTPFQVVGAPWMDGLALADALGGRRLPGLKIHAHSYTAATGAYRNEKVQGVRVEVTNLRGVQPVEAGVTLIAAIQDLYGQEALWDAPTARGDFFDKLMGTDSVRVALKSGKPAADIAAEWAPSIRSFKAARKAVLLYSP